MLCLKANGRDDMVKNKPNRRSRGGGVTAQRSTDWRMRCMAMLYDYDYQFDTERPITKTEIDKQMGSKPDNRMKLRKFMGGNRSLIDPVHERDFPLFEHCADGMVAVTEDHFNDTVKPLLECHGVKSFDIEK